MQGKNKFKITCFFTCIEIKNEVYCYCKVRKRTCLRGEPVAYNLIPIIMQNAKNAKNATATAPVTELRYYKAEPDKTIKTEIGRAVSKSYEIPAVAQARKVRKGCFVRLSSEPASAERHYESVRKAYDAEGINLAGHIPFRGRLRKIGELSLPVSEGRQASNPATAEKVYIFRDAERLLPEPEAKPEPKPEGKVNRKAK